MSAMFYLSRGGAPEGPFEEAHLLGMIESGELADGGVCPVGHSQWIALKSAPPFAQALAVRPAVAAQSGTQPGHGPAPGVPPAYLASPPPDPSVAQAGHVTAPTQPGHGPAPTQPDQIQGPGPTQPDYTPGPTQPDYTPGPTQPELVLQPTHGAAHYAGTGPAAKGPSKPLLFGGVAALLVLLVGGAVAAYVLFFASGGALRVSASMPQDCEFLIEVPSVRKLVADLRDVQFLDTSLRDEKQLFDNTASSLAKAFDLSQSDAVALLASSETFGIAGRNLASTPEVVIAMGMKNAAPVEALLKSARFSAA
ncbi:MAG: hypothetical protein ABJB12_23750, partial [Pseudomonadota bacterium]